jgi:hypothetical protein
MEAARPERGQLNALKLAAGRLVEVTRSDGNCKETGTEELTARQHDFAVQNHVKSDSLHLQITLNGFARFR